MSSVSRTVEAFAVKYRVTDKSVRYEKENPRSVPSQFEVEPQRPIFFLFFPIFSYFSKIFLFIPIFAPKFLFFPSFGIKHIDICRSALT